VSGVESTRQVRPQFSDDTPITVGRV
jgi:hypothetical protein